MQCWSKCRDCWHSFVGSFLLGSFLGSVVGLCVRNPFLNYAFDPCFRNHFSKSVYPYSPHFNNTLIHDIPSAVSKEGQTAPRSGFFHNFRTKEVLVKKYNLEEETFEDVHDEETIHRLQSNLKNLDRNLGAYPYDSWKKWVSLSNKISIETIQR